MRSRRLLAGAAVLVVLTVLATAFVTDVRSHARERSEDMQLTAARAGLHTARTDLTLTRFSSALTTNQRNGIQASVASTLGRITTTEGALAGAEDLSYLQGLDIGTLHTCLTGVQQSFQQIGAGDNTTASQDIASVAGACRSLEAGNDEGLSYPFDFPDPDVLVVGSTYYAYATNSVAGNIQIVMSTDLVHWTALGDALPSLPAWATPDETWAPAVQQFGATFVLYYAVRVAAPGGGDECLSVATATQPQGPFVDSSTGPLECQTALGGSIDPSPFVDSTGTPYLVWKSNGGAGASAIWSEQLDAAGTGFAPGANPTQILVPSQTWEGGVIEAPDLVSNGGRYFLFYSGNDWMSADYAVGVATCAGPLGPCSKPLSGPILASDSGMEGPGGETVFTGVSGATWIAFDAWAPDAVGYPNSRALYIRPISFAGATPVVGPA